MVARCHKLCLGYPKDHCAFGPFLPGITYTFMWLWPTGLCEAIKASESAGHAYYTCHLKRPLTLDRVVDPCNSKGGVFTPLFWLGGKGMEMGGFHWSWSYSREAEGTFASRKKQRSYGCRRRRRKILGKGTKSRCHRWRLARGLTQTLLRSMVDLFHGTLANLIC